jgi:hypothetical protein
MLLKTFSAFAVIALLGLGISACTTASGSSGAPAQTAAPSGGGY